MGWIIHDYECECGWADERMVSRANREIQCPDCFKKLSPCLSVPNLGAYSMASTERKADILRQRSFKDTHKQLKKEPEKFGDEGIRRAREGHIQVGYTGKKKGQK